MMIMCFDETGHETRGVVSLVTMFSHQFSLLTGEYGLCSTKVEGVEGGDREGREDRRYKGTEDRRRERELLRGQRASAWGQRAVKGTMGRSGD
jgi:hypothetical protein